jgi:hypothetical protein
MRTSHPERRTPTFRQFAMVMAAVTWFAVLLPVGARAAGQLVTLVDPTTSNQARVDPTNSLTVATRPATSTTWYYRVAAWGANVPLFKPPAGKTKLAISTLTWANVGGSASTSILSLYGNLDCASNLIGFLENVSVPAHDTVTVSFPQPLLIGPGGSNWCLKVSLGDSLYLTATGYYY